MNEYMQVTLHDRGSCRIETSPSICSANQWTGFCIIGNSVTKGSRRSSSTYTENLSLHVIKHNFIFLFQFFFYLAFHSRIFTIHRTADEGEDYLLILFLPLLPASQTRISWVIAAESSPLRIAGSRNRTWNLWYTLFRIHSFYTCTGSCCCQENA